MKESVHMYVCYLILRLCIVSFHIIVMTAYYFKEFPTFLCISNVVHILYLEIIIIWS